MYNFSVRVVKSFLLIVPALLILAIAVPTCTSLAQTPDSIYIEETGHWIKGLFLDTYQSVNDSLLIFGYPLSDEIVDTNNGKVIQYFQKARMELVEGANGAEIQIANLGEMLYQPGAPLVNISTSSPTCRMFPATGKSVCYAFRQFYDMNDGERLFGNPISDLEKQDNRYVQYFEKARMEWRPEMDAGQRVGLTDLGKIFIDTFGIVLPEPYPNGAPVHLIVPHALAFTSKALISANENQTVYIVAQDQDLHPLQGAMVMVIITWPDGTQDLLRPANLTDQNGICQLDFTVGDFDPKEIVQVEARVTYQDTEFNTFTWFRIWW
jgi:hypothetical protein